MTDDGLAHLRELKNLEELDLQGISVSKKGLFQIAALPKLRHLLLEKDDIEDAREFAAAMPRCKIELTR
ncbi:MAG: hypothetical protein O3C40_24550 [Planctomycetota bacterium]|nr:hypothetical protein [Planctomycetota bacterium]